MNYKGDLTKQSILKHTPIIAEDEYVFTKELRELIFHPEFFTKFKKTNYPYEVSNILGIHNHGIKKAYQNLKKYIKK